MKKLLPVVYKLTNFPASLQLSPKEYNDATNQSLENQ